MAIEFIKIEEQDVLNTGRIKLNNAIEASEIAYNDSREALDKAVESLNKSTSTQDQLDQIVIEGDSSVEAAQARVDANGNIHTTLKERIDNDYNEVTQERDQVGVTSFVYENELVTQIVTPTKTVIFEYTDEAVSKVTEIMEHKTIETTFEHNTDGSIDKISREVI